MPRGPRIQVPGGIYHVNAKGCAERSIFLDDVDRTSFEEILAEVIKRHEWVCSSFCLMSTHYHLLAATPHGDLAAGMRRLNGLYAQTFNRRHGKAGHLFKGRYHSEFIQSDSHLFETTRYVALNLCAPGFVENRRTGRGAASPRRSANARAAPSSPLMSC